MMQQSLARLLGCRMARLLFVEAALCQPASVYWCICLPPYLADSTSVSFVVLPVCGQVLDPENRGYIDEHTMHELLTENEWAFRDKEIEDFMRVAKDPDTNYIHYEDYVSMLAS
jgi:hypothetical protein